jgi:hypothetical protein
VRFEGRINYVNDPVNQLEPFPFPHRRVPLVKRRLVEPMAIFERGKDTGLGAVYGAHRRGLLEAEDSAAASLHLTISESPDPPFPQPDRRIAK